MEVFSQLFCPCCAALVWALLLSLSCFQAKSRLKAFSRSEAVAWLLLQHPVPGMWEETSSLVRVHLLSVRLAGLLSKQMHPSRIAVQTAHCPQNLSKSFFFALCNALDLKLCI